MDTHTERVFQDGSVQTIPKQNLFSFINNLQACVCDRGELCVRSLGQRLEGAGAEARMEMFGGWRGHKGWVDCWVMSHWSLLQSLLSNLNTPSNTQTGRSNGIWACGWKSWVGRQHTVCTHINDRSTHTHLSHTYTHFFSLEIRSGSCPRGCGPCNKGLYCRKSEGCMYSVWLSVLCVCTVHFSIFR